MSDAPRPLHELSDDELGRVLGSLAADLFPPTPQLTQGFASSLTSAPRSAESHVFRPGVWAAAAMLAALLVVPFFFSPALRSAAADFFGVPGVEIKVTDDEPHVDISVPDLGAPFDLASAQDEVPFTIRVPESLGAPDEVYLDRSTGENVVSLVYEPRENLPEAAETGVGLLIMEFEGHVPGGFIKKVAGAGSTLELVDVEGTTAYWISGEPHPVLYRDPQGIVRESTARLAANTLLFSRDGLTFRIEGDVPLARALEIARSL